jgi:hypothetical protein
MTARLTIERVRRAMPRNPDVMALCDLLDQLIPVTKPPVTKLNADTIREMITADVFLRRPDPRFAATSSNPYAVEAPPAPPSPFLA